jgi:hypothetical protein
MVGAAASFLSNAGRAQQITDRQKSFLPIIRPEQMDLLRAGGREHGLTREASTFLEKSGCAWGEFPEYDDAQGFQDEDGDIGAAVHVFGCFGVFFPDKTFFDQYTLVSPVWIESSTDYPAGDKRVFKNLKINTGKAYHCLYLRWVKTAPAHWEAYMDPGSSTSATGCANTYTGNPGARTLPVSELPNDETRPLAPSARLMQGRNGKLMYVGVPCAGSWCVIGTNRADVDESHPDEKAYPWYDFQVLSHKPNPSGKLQSANMPAYVTATDDLLSMTLDRLKTYQHVATVFIPGRNIPGKYATAGFIRGENEIYLLVNADGTTGLARVVNKDHPLDKPPAKEIKVSRTPFVNSDLPAVARWGWRLKDEEIWVRCDVGCCMVEISAE